MNIQGLIGKKLDQTQGFLEDGTRVPISCVLVSANMVTQVKSEDKEGYHALQLGFDITKKTTKAIAGHIKKAGITKTPRFLREIRVDEMGELKAGNEISVNEVFAPGDIIDVTGTSKGKGYAGVVKRYHFKGGPRTHGQSDRERAPGSIGQSTTPGRVYKGKRMAGRKGNKKSTIKNLEVVDIVGNTLLVKGLVPGPRGALVMIKKRGQKKKFVPLFKEKLEEGKAEAKPVKEVKENAS